jgi:hypothetical protein
VRDVLLRWEPWKFWSALLKNFDENTWSTLVILGVKIIRSFPTCKVYLQQDNLSRFFFSKRGKKWRRWCSWGSDRKGPGKWRTYGRRDTN